MNDSRLQRIQSLQFSDKAAAEALLLDFVRATFPNLDVIGVELRPLAVSLNSFNGFLALADGGRLFFKTHVEPGSVINEYYNSTLLAQSGYPVILPRYASTEYGKQFLIYDVIESPSVFDVAHAIERGERDDLPELTAAQNRADDQLLQIYSRTWEPQTADETANAAVQQLFYHRLGARYNSFYAGKPLQLPNCEIIWETLCSRQWQINGVQHRGTLGEAIACARESLLPAQEGPSIVGHGDAHNGNVFFTSNGLVYFDPAFGGRHHPLLHLAKPLFHHVLLRKQPAWRTFLKSALMCCPLLTMNLADSSRFPTAITLLGLCFAVEMGMESSGAERNILNQTLDEIEEPA